MPLRLHLIRTVRVEESRNLPVQLLGQTSSPRCPCKPDIPGIFHALGSQMPFLCLSLPRA